MTAAVVGIIANLAVWFSLHVLFAEVGEVRASGLSRSRFLISRHSTLQRPSIAVAAGIALIRYQVEYDCRAALLHCRGWRRGYDLRERL